MENARSLILVRHTRTDDNDDKIYSCQIDVPLNALGLRQALALAETLKDKRLTAIYTSDLRRARCVAEIIAAYHRHAPFLTDPRLRELDMGRLSGLTKGFVSANHHDPRFQTEGDYDFSSVGGESKALVVARQLELLQEVWTRHEAELGSIVLVGHGTSFRNLLEALGHPDRMHKQGEFTEL